jgi:hypothetical protein
MAINITSDETAKMLSDLGEKPHPEALVEFATAHFGNADPVTVDYQDQMPYVVTLASYDVQDNFYDEMESTGSRGYAPPREVECVDRMPTCRSTTYLMSKKEADTLQADPRVLAVELDPAAQGMKVKPFGYQYSAYWDKSGSLTSDMKNWGLLRGTNRVQISNWGSNGTANQAAQIVTTSTGKNVDVVVMDGNILPGHPEYARNADGSGGSRVNQFNWWSLNPQVTGQAAGTYDYTAGDAGNNGHGMHVAGIMAGNTCGWARDANIYNLSPYGEQTNGTSTPSLTQLINYIRYWHNNVKTVNPITKIKNPTVVNMSFGYLGNSLVFNKNAGTYPYVNRMTYHGVEMMYPSVTPPGQNAYQVIYNGNWAVQNFLDYGVQLYQGYIDAYGVALVFYTSQDAAADAAIVDGANEGIIWCAAGGNNWDESGFLPNNLNYDNWLSVYSGFFFVPLYSSKWHNRLPSPAHAFRGSEGVPTYRKVLVSANLGTLVNEQLSDTSQSGPAIDIVAPGTDIMSSYNSAGVADPRNPSYFLAKLTGTSMASPQTAGIAACIAEQYPNLSQMGARSYIQYYANNNAMYDPNIQLPPNNPVNSLRGAPNSVLTYYQDRPATGNPYPRNRNWTRPTSGAVYPRAIMQSRNVI